MSNRSRGLLSHLDLDHLDEYEDFSSEELETEGTFGKSAIHKHPEFRGNIKDKRSSNQRREKRKSRLENKHSLS